MAFKIVKVQAEDFQINQLQQNIASVIEPVFQNLSGQFVGSLTGCSSLPQGTFKWQRATSSGPVTVSIPILQGTSNTTAATITGLPSIIWPVSTQRCLATVYDSGTASIAYMIIGNDGSITLTPTLSGSTFTASGTKGIYSGSITYQTAL